MKINNPIKLSDVIFKKLKEEIIKDLEKNANLAGEMDEIKEYMNLSNNWKELDSFIRDVCGKNNSYLIKILSKL